LSEERDAWDLPKLMTSSIRPRARCLDEFLWPTVVDALLRNPDVKAISFIGSTPVARYIYAEGAACGKRAQCRGGAKNYVAIMPDADLEMAAKIVSDSAFDCAGQRCLTVSSAITVGEAAKPFMDSISKVEIERWPNEWPHKF
jgi:malonate-semialdehyde dehydrogenase (acetylating)/methylmalonate-semialdehyde dehydrogenase